MEYTPVHQVRPGRKRLYEKIYCLVKGNKHKRKNKISMSELKMGFAKLGFPGAATYLNSGNVVFLSAIDDRNVLSNKIELFIKDSFDLDIPVLVVSQDDLKDILNNAPCGWGDDNKEIYDNLIFMMPSLSYEEFCNEIGDPKGNMRRCTTIRTLFSGHSAGRITERQIGGQRLPTRR